MQEFFQNLQGKLWTYLVQFFSDAISFLVRTWESTQLWRKNITDFLSTVYGYWSKLMDYVKVAIAFISTKVSGLISEADMKYDSTKPIAVNLSQKSKIGSWAVVLVLALILIFWVWMIRHAKRNETEWKKTWIFVMIILGPLGAVIYYFFRKRKKEKSQDKHDKVMMSFFTPMHKNIEETKK